MIHIIESAKRSNKVCIPSCIIVLYNFSEIKRKSESTIKHLIVTVTTNTVHDFALYTSCSALSLLSLIKTISSESRPTGFPAIYIQLILNWNTT